MGPLHPHTGVAADILHIPWLTASLPRVLPGEALRIAFHQGIGSRGLCPSGRC